MDNLCISCLHRNTGMGVLHPPCLSHGTSITSSCKNWVPGVPHNIPVQEVSMKEKSIIGYNKIPCPNCDGRGSESVVLLYRSVPCLTNDGKKCHDPLCTNCYGSGIRREESQYILKHCSVCKGTGVECMPIYDDSKEVL